MRALRNAEGLVKIKQRDEVVRLLAFPSHCLARGLYRELGGPRGATADPSEDSSVADFDFLDEDDDIKKQPKL